MKELKVKFTEKITRTPAITSFRFIPSEKIEFSPGQFMRVIFDESNKDNRQLNKYLSFSSSPQKPYIEVTKRLSESEFSKRLSGLRSGEDVLIQAPLGNIIFLKQYNKIAFLIGGIGITPVISIIEYICEKKLNTDVFLFYSNRKEEDIAFRKELDFWQRNNKNIKIIYTITDCAPKDDTCVPGFIDKNLLKQKSIDFIERIIFIYGPPGMVTAMKGLCFDFGCDKEKVKTENFIGY